MTVTSVDLYFSIGGRITFLWPTRRQDKWTTGAGDEFVVPPPDPNAPPRHNLLMEVQANSARVFVTMSRYLVENYFLNDWRWQICGNRGNIPQQYLEPCKYPPAPQIPKIMALHLIKSAIEDDVSEGFTLKYVLPPGLSQKAVGEQAVQRVKKINWLDPQR